jgi:hypothetical protein
VAVAGGKGWPITAAMLPIVGVRQRFPCGWRDRQVTIDQPDEAKAREALARGQGIALHAHAFSNKPRDGDRVIALHVDNHDRPESVLALGQQEFRIDADTTTALEAILDAACPEGRELTIDGKASATFPDDVPTEAERREWEEASSRYWNYIERKARESPPAADPADDEESNDESRTDEEPSAEIGTINDALDDPDAPSDPGELPSSNFLVDPTGERCYEDRSLMYAPDGYDPNPWEGSDQTVHQGDVLHQLFNAPFDYLFENVPNWIEISNLELAPARRTALERCEDDEDVIDIPGDGGESSPE